MDLFASLDDTTVSFGGDPNWRPKPPPSLSDVYEVYLDCETNGLDWYKGHRPIGIGICLPNGTTQYLPFGHRCGQNLDEAAVRRWAQTELRNKLIHNISTKFDIHHLREWGCDLEAQGCQVADIAHDAALLDDHRQKFSLAALCEAYLPESERKVTQVGKITLDPNRFAEYPPDVIAVRCEADVRQVYLLQQPFDRMIEQENLGRVRQLERDVIFPVCEMERLGAPLNVELLHQWLKESERLLAEWHHQLIEQCGFDPNLESGADWARICQTAGIDLEQAPRTEKTGAVSFTDTFVKKQTHPLMQLSRRVKKLESLRSKYLLPYAETVGSDGILRYQLHQLRQDDYGTVTGRFSASNHNIQQVADAERQEEEFGLGDQFIIRQLFVPQSRSELFLSADAKQEEFRIAAHDMNSAKVFAAYEANPNLSYHEWVHELLRKYKPDLPYKSAKITNLAKLYCAGTTKIGKMLGLTDQEAREFVDLYNRTFPEMGALQRRAMTVAKERGYIRTLLGRRARFRMPEDEKYLHAALNRRIQGGAGDILKQKAIELHRARKVTGFKLRFVVHDEFCGDAPDEQSTKMVKAILNWQSFNLKVPILWDVKIGQNWAEC